ncbi:S8 family peptidase [Phragmitibacter flavus]|uniref:S8 family peptidase n=1 Tax=Phragmitibacter flavus TaxID=2576071 RepID=UPI00197F867B|nr:S8/S53 family peptidase [Phragmitibacter flavus]
MEALPLSKEELAQLEISAPGNSVRGFLIDGHGDNEDEVASAVKDLLGEKWQITRLDPHLNCYRATNPNVILSVPEAWSLSHQLDETKAIENAEPDIEWIPAPPEIGGETPDFRSTVRSSAGADSHLSCSTQISWHLNLINAPAAWAFSKQSGKPAHGKGVTIGQLDTGITYHAELPINNQHILLNKGRNLYDPQHPVVGNKPLDPMIQGKFLNPGHGTSTISILTGHKKLSGSARDAKIIPFRINPSVVHFEPVRIAEGIRHAHEAGCDVITMSMGGPPSKTKYLDQVVARAAEDGVIICCAAGNQIGSNNVTPLVVWPAALDQVIAVAGCNCQEEIWSGSSRGPEVNITAPAQSIWRAAAVTGSLTPANPPPDGVIRGDGTSFATPTVAGLAACWLAHHGGRKALTKHYGAASYVPQAFAKLLETVAYRRPPGWNTKLMGPGILDAKKLLEAPLPAKGVLGWKKKKHAWAGSFVGGVFQLVNSRASVRSGPPSPRARAGATSGASPAGLHGELAYLLFDRPVLAKLLNPELELEASDSPAPTTRRSGASASTRTTAVNARAHEECLEDAALLLRSCASRQLTDALS